MIELLCYKCDSKDNAIFIKSDQVIKLNKISNLSDIEILNVNPPYYQVISFYRPLNEPFNFNDRPSTINEIL